ncbi:hypothetical protein GJ744_001472 [Endocarpon pusillum]|uniref:Uncharacterized protein n=1 Tax=Endocarpon pusillum TaxID=364733 RepID=A0A8H7E1V3_9EURO|nr:hypothetical protein GJ744_001472 [Endocarpon pusillum]
MGLNYEDVSSLRTPAVVNNYLTWYSNRRHLFGPHPSVYMPAAKFVDITVHANRVEGRDVNISGVPYDATLTQSLISPEYAQATQGTIVQTEAELDIHSADGKHYMSSSKITLIWWLCGETISHREVFYITKDLPGAYNAMLHHMPDGHLGKKALPLFNKNQTAEDKKYAEERRKQEEKAHSATRQAEDQKIVDKTKKLTSSSTKSSKYSTVG